MIIATPLSRSLSLTKRSSAPGGSSRRYESLQCGVGGKKLGSDELSVSRWRSCEVGWESCCVYSVPSSSKRRLITSVLCLYMSSKARRDVCSYPPSERCDGGLFGKLLSSSARSTVTDETKSMIAQMSNENARCRYSEEQKTKRPMAQPKHPRALFLLPPFLPSLSLHPSQVVSAPPSSSVPRVPLHHSS